MKCQKHLFSLDTNSHYLNCAYKAPLLKSAELALTRAIIQNRNPQHIINTDYFENSDLVRKEFGKMVNCEAMDVAIIPSSSYGFSSVLNNIKPKINGNVVTLQEEFPSGYFSLKRWCDTHQNKIRIIGSHSENERVAYTWNQDLLNSIDSNTSFVLISSIHWMNGTKFDLKKIGQKCREHGALFIVDGTQSVGALPIDVQEMGIDALVCAAYKWLMGPYSMGLAYISKKFENGTPLEETWMNRINAMEFSNLTTYETQYKPGAGRYNMGETSNFLMMPMMLEGLLQLNEWGVSNVQEYAKNLIQPLKDFIAQIGGSFEEEEYFSNHLFSLKLPEHIDEIQLKEKMAEQKIIISIRGENIRVSVHVFNNESDIEELIRVIKSLI